MSDELEKLRAELEAARAEIQQLRSAVIAMCDTYSANRTEKLRVKAYRAIANKGGKPFSERAVEEEIARLEREEEKRR